MQDALVWEAFDQAALDAEYNIAATVPDVELYFEEYARQSTRVRALLASTLDIAYGPAQRQRLDLFGAREPNAPLLIYLHGGYWRRLDKDFFSFVAEPFVHAGAAVAVLNYRLAPEVTLDEIVCDARSAVSWLYQHALLANADRSRIFACGHSAGAQLAGMLASTDWLRLGLPADAMKGICTISGLFDLEPVRRSYVNAWLDLDDESAQRNSPLAHLASAPTPLVAMVGEQETAEFKRQTRAYASAWRDLGHATTLRVLTGRNHYDIVLDLLKPESPLRSEVVALLGIAPD